MACFLVPAGEAIVTTALTKVIEMKEASGQNVDAEIAFKERFSSKLKRLNHFLWGGAALLAFEHLWHGEIQPFFPFLTAAADPADFSEMLHEMSTVGVTMAVLVTAVWGVTTLVTMKMEQKDKKEERA